MRKNESLHLAASLALLGVLAVPGTARGQGFDQLALETLAEAPGAVVAITHAGDERLFLTLQDGRVLIHDGAELLPEPFLDIRDRVRAGGERGLLSVAFHPDHADNGLLFADYTDLAGDTVVARYRVSGDDPNRADPASEAVLLEIPQPFANHNGGQLAFGPDGYLYVSTGDGGAGFDPLCNGQRTGTLLGKILRLDVDRGAATPPFHAIPPDNPFAGPGGGRDEIWALGLRNPWRFSFDRVMGDLWIADVGQNAVEEVDREPAASPGGVNYGWKVMEGSRCVGSTDGCPPGVPPCNATAYTDPVLEYPNAGADCAVVGGHVYRGRRLPDLEGVYLFGDFCSGRLRAGVPDGAGGYRLEELPLTAGGLTAFGEDATGEIVLATQAGTVFELVGPPSDGACSEDATTLCLAGGRFRVEATWQEPGGGGGRGMAEPLTGDTGYFWFFEEDNVEMVVKVLDACDGFGRFWVFAGGLTNVAVTLTVTDTESDAVRTYTNPLGTPFQPIQDTRAFESCS